MSQADTHSETQPVYVNVMNAREASIQSRLPLQVDKPVERLGTRFDQELARLHKAWPYPTERRLGVGSDVVIEAGIPIQLAGSFAHYITTAEIHGKLKTESTTRYPPASRTLRSGAPYQSKSYEITDTLFVVAVELPDDGQPEGFLHPKTIDIHVPNDRLRKVEPTPTE
jgi:hypothetical protein